MNNMQRLSLTLDGRMKKTSSAAVPTTIELGTINANLSLTTDGLRVPIPKGDYTVNLMLSGGSYITSTETHSHSGSDHSHGGGAHSHSLPSALRGLAPGDRVLVAWCGNEPVVIAIIAGSSKLTYSGTGGSSGGGTGDTGSSGSGTDSGSSDSGTGTDGEYGFSPTVVVTPITGGNRVTITDVNGPKAFDVMDGHTPSKGKDYFTAEEVEAIVQETVKRVTAIFAEKYYSKEEIDGKIVTADDLSSMLDEVFGGK